MKGYSPIQTGLVLLPVMVTLVPSSILTGILVTRINDYRYPIWAGWVLTTVGSGLTLRWDGDTPPALWATTLVLLGLGHGAILNAQNFASQAMCNRGEEGIAAAMYGFLRQLGTAIGVSVGGSAFQNMMWRKLEWDGLPRGTQRGGFVTELLKLPTDGELKPGVLDAFVFGFQGVFTVYLAISGVALLLSLSIKRFNLDKELQTNHRLRVRD